VAITPGWSDRQGLWHFNLDVRRARATQGVMGIVPPGNWLPALPDGSLLGPMPAGLGARYAGLYGQFANAWRVTGEASLFDYARGTSAKTFAVDAWPGQAPKACRLPRQAEGAQRQPPKKKLALAAAAKHCGAIVADGPRSSCVQDVMAAGDPALARTYRLTEQTLRNVLTTAPAVVLPENDKADLAAPVTFTWQRASRSDGNPVTYMHCLWEAHTRHSFKDCAAIPSQSGTGNLSTTVTRLEPGRSYFWKVIAEDGKGGSIESETRRFTVK
jgi:hypothetical protein